ncbi:hypothetical protein CVO77_02410 [Sphingopyxis lindanitolerans]|uniref:Uncharacterized protein n=1 Tax=Sphingopyxis lindanitolerans TaxID=2054227 RepID=A0A2S8B572_9SPHN|nr:hypothetical protein [Sphingopyxis lindanitolerans]PQM27466.1 hypothetical protein CVO77_02410 [Sphingopyxis lindanitolerans]
MPRMPGRWRWIASGVILFAATSGGPLAAQGGAPLIPLFCQGISIDGGENSMILSAPFSYPQGAPAVEGMVRDVAPAKEFAAEVKRRFGKELLDSTCYTRPTVEELQDFATMTAQSNQSSWRLETIDWMPRGGRAIAATGTEQPAAQTPSDNGKQERLRAAAAEERAAREAAERAEAARIAEEQRAATENRRALNAEQAERAAAQLRQIEAEQRAAADRQRAYEAQQRTYSSEMERYRAAVQAAADAKRKWEADVAACQAGDYSRCASQP